MNLTSAPSLCAATAWLAPLPPWLMSKVPPVTVSPGVGRRGAAYANTIAAGALIFALTYLTLEIRRLYRGPYLNGFGISGAEQYTYSIAWLAFGVALLGIGISVNSQRARLASAAVIALTILKAFLVDMSTLTGVYRALSFICLGLVLVGIGWLYQRVLFRRRMAPPPVPAMQPEG